MRFFRGSLARVTNLFWTIFVLGHAKTLIEKKLDPKNGSYQLSCPIGGLVGFFFQISIHFCTSKNISNDAFLCTGSEGNRQSFLRLKVLIELFSDAARYFMVEEIAKRTGTIICRCEQ